MLHRNQSGRCAARPGEHPLTRATRYPRVVASVSRVAATAFCAVAFVSGPTAAQGWAPDRHVELTVPGGAGGSLDNTARTVQRLWQELKLVPVSSAVMNRAGGGHAIGYQYVRQRTGDPHHLGLSTSMLLSAHIAGYLPLTYTDVTPIGFLVTEYVAFAVHPDSPIKTGRDLVEALKKNPASLSFAMGAARGGTYHLATGLPLQGAGVDIKPIRMAFFSGGKQVTQVLGNHADVAVGGLASAAPHAEGGKLRIVAVSAPQRLTGALANVPTWEELGFKAGTYGSRRSIFAPKGITAEQVAYWENVLRRVVESDEFRKIAERNYWDATFKDAAETGRLLQAEYGRLKGVMAYLGLVKSAD
ncbi:MAG: tripartite tricarboxylate transporter substrate binding protein, partial [Burkholderiales bacterium]